MKTQTLIILSLIFVMSCKCNKTAQNIEKMANTESVLIAKGNLHGSGSEGIAKQNTVIENQSDWKNLLEQMNNGNTLSNDLTETEIDFSKYNVIAIFNDVKRSGGYKIELDIKTTAENTMVTVNHMSPKGNATSVMTQPYYMAKIEKTALPIVFQ